jgi:hypothetical protein
MKMAGVLACVYGTPNRSKARGRVTRARAAIATVRPPGQVVNVGMQRIHPVALAAEASLSRSHLRKIRLGGFKVFRESVYRA